MYGYYAQKMGVIMLWYACTNGWSQYAQNYAGIKDQGLEAVYGGSWLQWGLVAPVSHMGRLVSDSSTWKCKIIRFW